jgi:hypothetical protein
MDSSSEQSPIVRDIGKPDAVLVLPGPWRIAIIVVLVTLVLMYLTVIPNLFSYFTPKKKASYKDLINQMFPKNWQ